MARKISIRIALLMKRKKPSRIIANRAAFLAVRDEVKQALEEEWPLYGVWFTLHHEQKITFSYPTFCRYVNRFVTNKRWKDGWGRVPTKKENESVKEERRGEPDPQGMQQASKNKPTTGIREFKFDPVPKDEELF